MVATPQNHATFRAPRAPLTAFERSLLRYARERCRRSFSRYSSPRGAPRPPRGPVPLYLHVPFCEDPCLYCSFHRVPYRESVATAYFGALRREMRDHAERGFQFDTLAVGGGTPTVLPDELAETLRLARVLWPIRRLTVESSPDHLSAGTISLLRSAGVERLSVGVQSFQDEAIAILGRQRHGSSADLRAAVSRATGSFATLNVDLMLGFPGQTLSMAVRDATAARELGVSQVTLYPIMYTRRTRQAFRRRGDPGKSAPLAELYAAVRDVLGATYRPTSAWCYSRENSLTTDEYIVDGDEYAGLGSGAFGFVGSTLWATTFSIPGYIEAIQSGRSPYVLCRRYSRRERWEHRMLMGLFGGSLGPAAPEVAGGLAELLSRLAGLAVLSASGDIWYDAGRLRTTERGQYLAMLAMREFFQAVNELRDVCRAASREDGSP